MGNPAVRKLSYDEYLALERETDLKHEYLDGVVRAMAGGSARHAAISMNLGAAMRSLLRGSDCRPYGSDLKVIAAETGLATYPDVSVVCGGMEPHPDDRHCATNPTLLAEVLSTSTEAWDRGGKWEHYRSIPTLRHYLLVRQDVDRIEHYERQDDGSWRLTIHDAGGVLPLAALKVELPVDEVFADLPTELAADR